MLPFQTCGTAPGDSARDVGACARTRRSTLSARLRLVQAHLAEALDHAPAGPVRLVSLCAGQGRDVTRRAARASARDEALSHADVLTALRETSDDVDWFYVSPAAGFGSYAPGEATGTYRVGGDVLLTDASGTSFISGADFALAFVDEIEQGRHHRERFTAAY